MVRRAHALLAVLAAVLIVQACRRTPEPDGPPPTKLEAEINHPVSYYRMPIYYPVDRFETWLNGKISGTFVDHGFPVEGGKDSLYLVATRTRPIRMRVRDGKLAYSLPLDLEGNYFKRVLGIKIGHRHPIKTSIVLHFSSAVDVDRAWNIVADTKLDRVEWEEDPHLRIGPVRIPLRKYLQNMIEKKQDVLLAKMDSAIYEHVDLRKAIAKVWGDIQKPMAIVKEEPKVWYKIRGREIYGAVSLLSGPDEILFDVLVAAHSEIGLDSLALAESSPLPNIKARTPPVDTLSLAVKAAIPFETVNQLLRDRVWNLEYNAYGLSLKVRRAIMYGTDTGVAIRVDVTGSLNGSIYLVGKPEYNEATKQLAVTNVNYDISTQNQVINAANSAFYESVLEFLSGYLVLYVGDEMNRLPGLISGAIEKGKSAERLDLVIDSMAVHHWDFLVTRSDIQFVLTVSAQAAIEIENLRIKRPVRIGEGGTGL